MLKKIERLFGGRKPVRPKKAWRILADHCDAIRIPTAQGVFMCSPSDDVIARSLFLGEQFGYDEFSRMMDFVGDDLPEGAIFLDVGANIGTHTVYALNSGRFERAICFEPVLQNFAFLRQNIELNGLEDRADIRNTALGRSVGKLCMSLSSDNYGDHRISETGSITVPVTTLDDALEGVDLTKCFLHMDVQGYEAHVLLGATALLDATRFVFSEFWPDQIDAKGMRESYLDSVSRFREVIDIETGETASIEDLPAIFDHYRRSEGTNLLFRR